MKNVLIVFNTESGRKKASSLIKVLYKRFKREKIQFKFVFVKVVPFLKDIAKYDAIIVVGGDGTLNAVLPLLVNVNKTLGIIPCGTANLLAANLSIPNTTKKALDVIFKSKIKIIDSAKVNERYFILRLGFGYDAEILNKSTQKLKRVLGYFAYILQGFFKLFAFKHSGYKIKLDEQKYFISADTIIIANAGNMLKNILTITPDGTIDDGKLDVFIRRSKNIFDFVEVFLRIVFKDYKQNDKVIYTKASNIVIKSKNKAFHIDGEEVQIKNDLNIQVIPKSIKVFVP